MKTPLSRFYRAIWIFFSVLCLGALGYVIAGWPLIDAVYMMVITIFSVGYREVHEINTPALKIYTMFCVFGGTGSALYVFGTVIQMITEGELRLAMGASRMSREIEHLNNHTIVCGFGRIGRIIGRQLHDAHHKFIVMDTNPERIRDATAMGYAAHLGNALDERDLRAVHVERARVLATVLPSDADNVFITLSARNLNPDITIIARGEQGSTEQKLRQAGANHVVMPAAIGGKLVSELILHPGDDFEQRVSRMELFRDDLREMGLQVHIITIPHAHAVVGHQVSELAVTGHDPFIIVGVRTADTNVTLGPHSTNAMRPGDQVVVVGARGDVPGIALK